MPRNRKMVLIVFAVLTSLSVGWVVAGLAYAWAAKTDVGQVGDIMIKEVSSAGADWVVLKNVTEHEVDLSGFILTDGDNQSRPFPAYTSTPGVSLSS